MLDDDAQIDQSTLPENRKLTAELDDITASLEEACDLEDTLAERLASVVPVAARGVEARATGDDRKHAKEEDLRGGIVDALSERDELILTEARLAVSGWTKNLGGFDIAMVVDNSLVVAETKWADGNLRESMWDVFKLASARLDQRIGAAVAVYGAPAKRWAQPDSCARIFEDRALITLKLIEALPTDWARVLGGSTASPKTIPARIHVDLLSTTTVDVFGKAWEVRAIAVRPDGGPCDLTDGWPHGEAPPTPEPYRW